MSDIDEVFVYNQLKLLNEQVHMQDNILKKQLRLFDSKGKENQNESEQGNNKTE